MSQLFATEWNIRDICFKTVDTLEIVNVFLNMFKVATVLEEIMESIILY